MRPQRSPIKIVSLIAVLLIVGAAAFVLLRPSSDEDNNKKTKSSGSSALQAVTMSTDFFTYQKPSGWAKLSKQFLDDGGAASGVALPDTTTADALPHATFVIKMSDTTPKDDAELKNHSIDDIKKNAPNFKEVSSESIQLDGESGQKFVYTFGETDKTKQELYVAAHSGKTYFLLCSANETVFTEHQADCDSISSSFKFK